MPLIFGSEQANRQLEIDMGKRLSGISVWTDDAKAEMTTEDEPSDSDRYCTVCGRPMEWSDCWYCGGDGEFDVYDEDPINYAPGQEFETCEECHGEGGYWECASLPHGEGAS